MKEDGVYIYPNVGNGNSSSIDPAILLALSGNNGFGGMNNPLWMMFMYPFILPFFNGIWGNNWGGNGANGAGFLANQLNNDAGRDLLLQAFNGRADSLGQLVNITHSSVNDVRNAICTALSKLEQVGSQFGMTGMQVINAVQSGDANIASKLAECCCENRLAIANQTNTLQSQIAANDANLRLELAKNSGDSRLAICQQTNNISNQMDRNTNSIMSAIANQTTMLTQEFCALKERELQNKIDTQSDIITQLRGQISNDAQTATFTRAFNELDSKICAIAAKQPNTVPVQYPNIVAANATPYVYNPCGGFVGYGNPYPQNNFWN